MPLTTSIACQTETAASSQSTRRTIATFAPRFDSVAARGAVHVPWCRLSDAAPATVAQLLARLVADAERNRAPPRSSNAIISMRSRGCHFRPYPAVVFGSDAWYPFRLFGCPTEGPGSWLSEWRDDLEGARATLSALKIGNVFRCGFAGGIVAQVLTITEAADCRQGAPTAVLVRLSVLGGWDAAISSNGACFGGG